MTTATTTKPADIILNQFGGSRRLKAMINGRDFFSENDGMTLRFKFSSCRDANVCKVTLDADDTYTFELIKIGRLSKKTYEVPVTEFKSISGIYADQLRELFTAYTGLYLPL